MGHSDSLNLRLDGSLQRLRVIILMLHVFRWVESRQVDLILLVLVLLIQNIYSDVCHLEAGARSLFLVASSFGSAFFHSSICSIICVGSDHGGSRRLLLCCTIDIRMSPRF